MSKAAYLTLISKRITDLDQRAFARRYLAWKLGEAEREPIPSRWLTIGQAKAVKAAVDKMFEAANA